jgi:hypothetical protein
MLPRQSGACLDLSPHFDWPFLLRFRLFLRLRPMYLVIGLTVASSSPVVGMQTNIPLGGW